MRPAIIIKSEIKVCELPTTALSDAAVWFELATIVLNSPDTIVRPAIIVKSAIPVLMFVTTAVSEAAV